MCVCVGGGGGGGGGGTHQDYSQRYTCNLINGIAVVRRACGNAQKSVNT